MDVSLFGVRISTGQDTSIKATKKGDLYVAQGLPPYAVLNATGCGYQVQLATAAASVIDIPTTASLLFLWNGEAGGGKSYVISRMWVVVTGAEPSDEKICLLACLTTVGTAAPVAELTPKSLSGSGTYGGEAHCDADATIVDNGWFAYGPSADQKSATTLMGGCCDVPIDGRLIVRPTSGLAITSLSGEVGVLVKVGVEWYEVQLDLG